MKKFNTFLSCVFLLTLPLISRAQTLVIDSISGTQFCAGEPISVTFAVTGTWGHNNAFIMQLSDATGSFGNTFTNLGSVKDTAAGSFTITTTIPSLNGYTSHYRVRVIAAFPYMSSADNGTDITIGQLPGAGISVSTGAALEGDTVTFSGGASYGKNNTFFWNFGDGATPPTSTMDTAHVWFSTTGPKPVHLAVTSPMGCTSKTASGLTVFSCNPAVPSTAYIDSENFTADVLHPVSIWVMPSATANYDLQFDTIFAEAGSSVVNCLGCVIYLKEGASYSGGFSNTVIYSSGASVSPDGMSTFLHCPSLSFDYSVAPPNSIMHINDGSGVAPVATVAQIGISPNPTNGMIALDNVPANASITAMNVLGQTVQETKAIGSGNCTLDISSLAPGTYYIRIASQSGVVTKKIVKE